MRPNTFRPLQALAFATSILAGYLEVSAIPLYYTFGGTVSTSYAFDGAVTTYPLVGYPAGTSVTHTFLIDQESDGYIIFKHDGMVETETQVDRIEPNFIQQTFLVEYIGGSALPTELDDYDNYSIDSHYGLDQLESGLSYSVINGSNARSVGHEYILVDVFRPFSDWAVGQNDFTSVNYFNNPNDGTYQYVAADLSLLSISSSNPLAAQAVPEPAGLALFSLGLMGLAVCLRPRVRKQRK